MFRNLVKVILSRTAVLYVLAAGFLLIVGDFPIAWNHVVTSALSRYMPAHEYLKDFDKDRTKFDFKKNKEFELYYRKLTEFMPELPEANAMLGFCYFYDGKIDRAMAAYQKAARLEPKVFNFYYNQAIIALERGDRARALEYFKQSLDVPITDNLQFIVTSRMYKPLLPDTRLADVLAKEMGEHVYAVYRWAYFETLALAEEQKDYSAMLRYARQGSAQGLLEAGVGNYYAGRAAYGLKEYEAAAGYLQEAIRSGFHYAQAFEMIGISLRALDRRESAAALAAAASLAHEGKIFKPAPHHRDLLIY